MVRTITKESEETEFVQIRRPRLAWLCVLLWQQAVDWNEDLEGCDFQHSSRRELSRCKHSDSTRGLESDVQVFQTQTNEGTREGFRRRRLEVNLWGE
jgi:hypothetical protein